MARRLQFHQVLRPPKLTGLLYLYNRGAQRIAAAWPRHRPRRKTLAQREREQRLTEFDRLRVWTDARGINEALQAVKNCPIRMRDLITAIAAGRMFSITLQDGRRIYPSVFRDEVADALDHIGDEPGAVLTRTHNNWRVSVGCPGQVLVCFGDVGAYWKQPADTFL